MSHSCSHAARRGVTLVELLVVTAIIGVLLSMMIPAVQVARQATERLLAQSDEYQDRLALAMEDDTASPPTAKHLTASKPVTVAPSWWDRLWDWILGPPPPYSPLPSDIGPTWDAGSDYGDLMIE